jgi:hypothetical protein
VIQPPFLNILQKLLWYLSAGPQRNCCIGHAVSKVATASTQFRLWLVEPLPANWSRHAQASVVAVAADLYCILKVCCRCVLVMHSAMTPPLLYCLNTYTCTNHR